MIHTTEWKCPHCDHCFITESPTRDIGIGVVRCTKCEKTAGMSFGTMVTI